MFYVIKHTPTSTYVPKLSSPIERSHYYSFLDGETPTKPPIFTQKDLTFKIAFKYRTREIADNFRIITAKKLRKTTPEQALESFEVLEFERWPREELNLHNPTFRTNLLKVPRFTTGTVPDNWMDFSELYCNQCGSFIPPGMSYMKDHRIIYCAFCLSEVFHTIKASLDSYPDKELLEAIQTQRFVEQI